MFILNIKISEKYIFLRTSAFGLDPPPRPPLSALSYPLPPRCGRPLCMAPYVLRDINSDRYS